VVDRLPPSVKIRPNADPGQCVTGTGSNGKVLGLGRDVPSMLTLAYMIHSDRLLCSVPVPKGRYDYISNLPQWSIEALRQEIQKQFGLSVRREVIETHVLILTIKTPNARGLRHPFGPIYFSQSSDSYSGHNLALWDLVEMLRARLGTMVIDGTGLHEDYDIDLKWDSTPEGLKQVVLEQLGLELTPTRQPVEFLRVEKSDAAALNGGATPAPVPPGMAEADFAPRAGSDLQGYWKGTVGEGPDAVPLDLKIAVQTNGIIHAEGDCAVQGVKAQPVFVICDRPTVKLVLSGLGMAPEVFQGKINSASAEIAGALISGGQNVPAVLRRADYQAERQPEAAKDYAFTSEAELQGHWKGILDLVLVKFRLNLDIGRLPDGTYATTLRRLDQVQENAPIPTSTFKYSPPTLTAAWKWYDLSFEGELKNGKLAGTWHQGGEGFPIVFDRQP
jgi:uncharacterized protein (TIGR03435 family)